MAGNNSHYHLSLKTEFMEKLKKQAKEEGLFLSELIRIIFWNWLRKDTEINYFKKIDEKLDKLLGKK